MSGRLTWRYVLVSLVALIGILYVLPSMPFVQGGYLAKFLPGDQISLGLDLRGGIHLTLAVDIDKAVANSLSQMAQDIKSFAQDEKIGVYKPESADGKHLEFTLVNPDKKDALEAFLKDKYSILRIDRTEPAEDGKLKYVMSMTPEYKKYMTDLTIDQAVKTIRNRIDQFGVAEPDIRKQADGRIQVQLPGLQDPERAIQIIGQTAHLEFKLVDDESNPEKVKTPPPGREIGVYRYRNPDGSYLEKPIVLKKEAVMTGEYISDARASFDNTNQPYVVLNFNARGAKLFERLTGENIKKRLAIVLDGKVYSAPVIQDKIAGGRASITGHFTVNEARDLAIVLRAGSLPAPVTVLEQRSVGPSLGQESIDKGVFSALVGGLAVIVFMAVYYGFAGVVADVALLLNIVLILAGLALFGATLTLPGIAGIILTIGMAVDANVIIFERIREETKRGLTPHAAMDEGYSRATLTILDANLTTIIAAIVLYQFGTGPIRGFAVTLILGIVASMFTAIFASKVLMDTWLACRKPGAALNI
ncbi:MAG: protein translocase subunit SecD [Desulfovibrionaceae bacterium]|nr:protein translocase subunit SecD [Desulfovibrionaceae bacterium]MBF0512800.1 protein translocase subunit SecD [Desulfovibrionaceae bacterium]